MPKARIARWEMDTSDLIDECEELERERDEALVEVEHFRAALKLEISDNQKERDEVRAEIEGLRKERDVYKQHADYWERHKLEDGLDPALHLLAMKYLPDWAWCDLGLASTTYTWWKRLRELLERPRNTGDGS